MNIIKVRFSYMAIIGFLLSTLALLADTSVQGWSDESEITEEMVRRSRPRSIRVASFNIQTFGVTKMKEKNVTDIIKKILRRYDLVMIQEIRDKSGTAIRKLVKLVNGRRAAKNRFSLILSKRLGKSFSKEQYGFLYKKSYMREVRRWLAPDPSDKMEREPLFVEFNCPRCQVENFWVGNVHIDPDEAFDESKQIPEFYRILASRWKNPNVLLAGDFNADCKYLSGRKRKELKRLFGPEFHWLIKEDADTTVKSTDCAYDRFIVRGEALLKAVSRRSVKVFNFEKYYKLKHSLALDVSDHYPIELRLKLK